MGGRIPDLRRREDSFIEALMSVEELALGLPRVEKLRLMEMLWADLSEEADAIKSPSWHEAALKETEARLADGLETAVDWQEAKRILRERR